MQGQRNDYEEALEVLRQKGWHQGGYTSPETGAVCSMGALNIVRSGNALGAVDITDAEDFLGFADDKMLASIILEQYPECHRFSALGYNTVPEFNDCADTTFADVERAFEKAAVRASEIID